MNFSIYLNGYTSKINDSKNYNYSVKTAHLGNITFN